MEANDHYDENELEPRALLSSLVERALEYLSGLRPYARRAQQTACDVLYQEGVDLAYDITSDATQDLSALCARADTWAQKIVHWVAAVSDTVHGLWGKARTHFTLRHPTGSPAPDQQPTFDQLVAEVQDLKLRMTTLEGTVQDLAAEVRTGFATAKKGRENGFAAVRQEITDGFAKIELEFRKAREHREHMMTNCRQGEGLEKQLDGYITHTLNRTLRRQYRQTLRENVVLTDKCDMRPWKRLQQALNLSGDTYVWQIDWLTELQWLEASATPRTFLACEATITLDQAHIAKLTNACQQLTTAGHRVVGILGYVKAPTQILDVARATDLVLLRFPNDMDTAHVTEETAGFPLAARLRDLVTVVATPVHNSD